MLSRYVQESKNRNGTESEIKLVKLRRVHSCTEGSKRRYLCQERIGKKKTTKLFDFKENNAVKNIRIGVKMSP